jgi:hypothetical protein
MGQRDAFRESFRDAFDGIDVEELQTGRAPRVVPAVLRGAEPHPGEPAPLTQAQLDEAVARLAARVDAVHLAVQRHREVTDQAMRALTARLMLVVGAGLCGLAMVVLVLALLLRR